MKPPIKAMPVFYREALATISPTCRSAATLGAADMIGRNPIGVEADSEPDTQVSRGGKPGLEVATASRYFL